MMKALDGTWDVTIKTPIGSLAVVYTFAESDGVPTGSATLSKPVRLNLDFDVVIEGDRLTGHSPSRPHCHRASSGGP
jgi:hypothetical protein